MKESGACGSKVDGRIAKCQLLSLSGRPWRTIFKLSRKAKGQRGRSYFILVRAFLFSLLAPHLNA
jgi:hypothetical protein